MKHPIVISSTGHISNGKIFNSSGQVNTASLQKALRLLTAYAAAMESGMPAPTGTAMTVLKSLQILAGK